MMAECRWIHKLSFLILMLQINTTETGQNSFTCLVRVGDEVTLPCRNVTDVQPDCGSTEWIFRGLTATETIQLIHQGSIGEKAQSKSDRLRVTADCSLLIKNMTVGDVGHYACRHSTSPHNQQHIDFDVLLSVINMTEHENNGKVTLFCSVLDYDSCAHTVQWMYEGEENSSDMKISEGSCTANVTFTISDLNQKSKFYKLLKCNVMNQNTKEVQLFYFSRQSSGPSLLYIVVPVCLAALLIVVAVVMWRKTKGEKSQMEENAGLSSNPAGTQSGPGTRQDTDDPADDVSYVSVSHTRKTSRKAGARFRDELESTVTYSALAAPSSSLEVSTDPNNLYATINK